MARRTREDKIIGAVECPECRAAMGVPCRFKVAELGALLGRAVPIHAGRRRAWLELRVALILAKLASE
jgi:hypothetical protein